MAAPEVSFKRIFQQACWERELLNLHCSPESRGGGGLVSTYHPSPTCKSQGGVSEKGQQGAWAVGAGLQAGGCCAGRWVRGRRS